jgi:hypothetical protein
MPLSTISSSSSIHTIIQTSRQLIIVKYSSTKTNEFLTSLRLILQIQKMNSMRKPHYCAFVALTRILSESRSVDDRDHINEYRTHNCLTLDRGMEELRN